MIGCLGGPSRPLPLARLLLLAALALAPAACGSSGAAARPAAAPRPLLAHPLPDFQRRTVGGDKLDTKGLRGRVVVVKFFAKYCEPCKRTLPAIEKLATDHAEIAFVGVAEDERESDVREVIATYGLTFPVIHDAGNILSGRFRVREMPYTFVADSQGTVRWVGGPEQTEGELVQAIESVR